MNLLKIKKFIDTGQGTALALSSLLLLALGLIRWGSPQIAKGSEIKFHYTLRVDDQVVHQTDTQDPVSYIVGKDEVIPGLAHELKSMEPGEQREIWVPPDLGYGKRNKDAIHKFPRSAFDDRDLELGDTVYGEAKGQQFEAAVVALDERTVTLDLNHPLAGKVLKLSVEIVSISPSVAL